MDATVALGWPATRVGEALEALARACGLAARTASVGAAPPERIEDDSARLDRWLEAAGRSLDVEVEPIDVSYAKVEGLVRSAGPALLRLPGAGSPSYLALHGAGRHGTVVLGPDRRRHTVPVGEVAGGLRQDLDEALAPDVERLLDEAGVDGPGRARARAALHRDRLGAEHATSGWLLRPSMHAGLWRHMRWAKLPRALATFLGAHVLHVAAWATAWWIVGRAAFEGRFDPGTLLAWSFLLFTLVPLSLLGMWSQGVFAIGTGALLKQRLLDGAVRLDPDETRHEGVGRHLARVFESEAVESLAQTGGFTATAAVLELALAVVIFALAGQTAHVALLLAAVVAAGLAVARHVVLERRWTEGRLAMTHDLVERMVGHRTRLAQAGGLASPDEDEALETHLATSRRMDAATTLLGAVPRGWLLLAILGLAPSFVSARLSAPALAVTLGAALLAYGALGRLASGLTLLGGARIAWGQVAPLLAAARRRDRVGALEAALPPDAETPAAGHDEVLVSGHDLAFRFPDRAEPVFRGVNLELRRGERALLAGPPGGGKSTLVSLIAGLRPSQSGVLLLDGLDRPTLGLTSWRRRVVAAVQFQDNHVFTESLAFNLLMGRRWPPRAEDLALADAVCRRLGLGDLIDRMPAGLFQLVGETGWQLSHGERSRVFVARALLQGADLVILDESFAELDPDSLRGCLREVEELAPSLIVIAHA